MNTRLAILGILLLLAGCADPPPDAYVGGSAQAGKAVGIGANAAGEACSQQASGGGGADIFCGSYQQPSGAVRVLGSGGADAVAAQATGGPWRAALDQRFACDRPRATTILGDAPAQVMACTRRIGGWPQVALVASVGGTVYGADGITPALPALERSIAVLSGRATAASAPSGADSLLASRLAAQAFAAGDIGQYDALMAAGLRANQSESFVAAEQAYRAALQVQQKAIGRDNPNTAIATMRLAVQQSNLHRYPEAGALFATAARLAPHAADPLAVAELSYDQGLDSINQGHFAEALARFRRAEAAYAATLPPEMLAGETAVAARPISLQPLIANNVPVVDAAQESALIGVIETRRYEGIALRGLGREDESAATIHAAQSLAAAQGLRQPSLTARLSRSAAATAEAADPGRAASGYARAAAAFEVAVPGSRPVAETLLLRATALAATDDPAAALPLCRQAVKLLRDLQIGTRIELLAPCLEVWRGQAGTDQALLAEMFEAAQLAQGSITSQEIEQASARLALGARDPRIGEAIRRRQDAGLRLAELVRARTLRAAQTANQRPEIDLSRFPQGPALDAAIDKAQAELADADAAVQAAAPNYGQLVQQVVPAADVLGQLRPHEAFASIVLAPNGTWTFILRDGRIVVGRSEVGTRPMGKLVKRMRDSVEDGNGSKPFDIQAAQAIYAATLGTQGSALTGATALVVSPTGPLLAIPFNALLTGPADPDHLGAAPWLVRQMSVSHVPAPANFVSLRKLGPSAAARPWFGMGDFRPVTLVQAEHSFPAAACRQSAKLFAELPPLPLTGRELTAARELLGGSPQAELVGGAYTVKAVQQAGLADVRVLHFASHALLPADLTCLDQPAIVTSAPAGAPDATGALLTSSTVANLKLDAQLVILSACNTGGGQATGGESLSGLARAFFYAGARALIVTHWEIEDRATTYLVSTTLKHLHDGDGGGPAGSLRLAQLDLLNAAGQGAAANLAHPFFWAPFALVGEGGPVGQITASR
jgi:CHAT domain-containing protein